MNVASRYWKLCRLSLTRSQGYEILTLPKVQAFCQEAVANLDNYLIQSFYQDNSSLEITALSGLALRCYVSYPILQSCKKLANLFGGSATFTYRDLLPFVLNDDGQQLRILDRDQNQQLILEKNQKLTETTYPLFTLEILKTYQPNDSQSMSLENWAYLQTKQNKEVKQFLSEFGFQILSDWALLNRVKKRQLEQLSDSDRSLIEVFHAVYRRDRRQQASKRRQKCPNPTEDQLQEMLTLLQQKGQTVSSTASILQQLQQVALQLRQYDVWRYRESLEAYDPESGDYRLRSDLPQDHSNDVQQLEQNELSQFLQNGLNLALENAIKTQIDQQINKLKKSRKYAIYADQFKPGLCYYYKEGKSLKEIATLLQMSSWDQARRILNPGDLLNQVRTATIQNLLTAILEKVKQVESIQDPNYLKTVATELEFYLDQEIFKEAISEIKAGKNRTLNSVYANALRHYLTLPMEAKNHD